MFHWVSGLFIIAFVISVAWANMKLTNIECKSLNKMVTFKKCQIVAINRDVNAVSMNITLAQSIDNTTVNLQIMKKSNTWKKFLYEFKDLNVCEYLKNPKRLPFLNYMYQYLNRFSNMNHKCPFAGELFINRMTFDANDTYLNIIQLGHFALFTSWKAYGIPVAIIRGYLDHSDYRKDWF